MPKDPSVDQEEVDETTDDLDTDHEENDEEAELEDDQSKKVDDTSGDGGQKDSDDEIDYKAELEARTASLTKAEKKIVDLKKKIKSKADVKEDEEESDDEEEPIRSEDKSDPRILAYVEDVIDEEVEKLTQNPDEQNLIRHIYNNRLQVAGVSRKIIRKGLEDAFVLANAKRLLKLPELVRRKEKSDRSASKGSTPSGKPPGNPSKVTAEDRKQAARYFKGDVAKWMKYKNK